MTNCPQTPGVVTERLSEAEGIFSDIHEKLSTGEAAVAADRCYFCHDAPCVAACPTEIEIPRFIRQIQTGQPTAAARTIFDQNILGGMCARACPTDALCEGACARETSEGGAVEIGRLQRYATDIVIETGSHPYRRASATGCHVVVVGAGPAGLACAHRLAMYGHQVTLMDAREDIRGLSQSGIAEYQTPDSFAHSEIDWLLRIGGITVKTGMRFGRELSLSELRKDYDAVFLAIGLTGTNALRAEGEEGDNVHNAVDFLSDLEQAPNRRAIAVGRNVVVIGGGMTAVDAAVQSKLLGADSVTMVYRRDREKMSASGHEQLHAASKGVRIVTGAIPLRILGDGRVEAVEFSYAIEDETGMRAGEETFAIPADQVFKAIGQRLDEAPGGLALEDGRIAVSGPGRTSLDGVWAGGDCAAGGRDLTVIAVAEGRDAAEDIHLYLCGQIAVAAE